jgi:hypothetical protein
MKLFLTEVIWDESDPKTGDGCCTEHKKLSRYQAGRDVNYLLALFSSYQVPDIRGIVRAEGKAG